MLQVQVVRVTKRVNEAYFAQLYVSKVGNEKETISFDLRPSDAINLAVRCKVPVQVHRHLAYTDGMRVVEPSKPVMQAPPLDGMLFMELDRPDGQPCMETEEFGLIQNMLNAAIEERYKDAGKTFFFISSNVADDYSTCSVEGPASSAQEEKELDMIGILANSDPSAELPEPQCLQLRGPYSSMGCVSTQLLTSRLRFNLAEPIQVQTVPKTVMALVAGHILLLGPHFYYCQYHCHSTRLQTKLQAASQAEGA
ncbi:hypothetical protein ZIOFF_067393 [Zingiber officinale]|uniref:BFN domain-containing protein n=1 Tax=Zingiber officinale TaxID=94328 RepID=A0A8J5ER17_ZINOF|nr:hypothetical protein ZIOFF_067393 [Zingiber officinale]